MAIKTWNGATFDDHLGATGLGSSSVAVTTAGVTSTGFTAPNLVNACNGVWLPITTVPTSGNFKVDLMESGVQKATATIIRADMVTGWNYVRFSTPYVFATLTANAYTIRVSNTAVNSGTIRQATSTNILYQATYNSATTLGSTDDLWIGGFLDSGLTPKAYNATGTSLVFGSGADTTLPTTWATGWGLMIGNGGSFAFDNTADTTVQIRGSIGVYSNGLFDMRANVSNIEIVNTLIFDNNAGDGNYGIIIPSSGLGGQVLTTGKTVSVVNTFASGVGTAANPVVTQTNHGFTVNDEVVIGGALDYLKNEVRFVKSIPAANQLVLSTTIGGAEAALTQSHSVGSHICNMTRNSVIKNQNITRGFSINNVSSSALVQSDFSYTRAEYPNCLSGRALAFNSTLPTTMDGFVLYNNSANGRGSINISGLTAQTITNMILFNTRGTNYSAQSGLTLPSASNKTINGIYHFAEPSSTTNCAMLSIPNTATNNIINNAHSYGANAGNGGAGYAIGVYGSGNTFNNCSVNAARGRGTLFSQCVLNTFNNCNFGTIATNTNDILLESTTLIQALFNNCSFGSATLISNYLNTLEGSLVAFQDMDTNQSKHRWYTNKGSFWSSGPGLTETTVRTVGSLALAIKPENSTDGATMTFKVPANPTSEVFVYGYLLRNATFSSGELKVELFLPGTLLTSTPDDTYTLPTTTGSWMAWVLKAYNPQTVSRYATVRITAKTATAGAFAFLDDLYDAGTANKVAGLDLWDSGQISSIMIQSDFSSVANVTTTQLLAELEPQIDAIPTAQENADAVEAELADEFAAIPGAVNSILADDFDAIPTASENALAVQSQLNDDFDAIPTAAENATAVEAEIGTELNEILSNTDATQAKIDQL